MTTHEFTLTPGQAANMLVVINAVERLPLLTEHIIDGIAHGEAYDTLCRQLRTLHHNLVEISEMAVAAKISNSMEAAEWPAEA